MLILSKFHDYYDTALSFGIDKTVVYRRESSEKRVKMPEGHRIPSGDSFFLGSDGKAYLSFLVVGFAGKFYPAAKLMAEDSEGDTYKSGYYYDSESLFAQLENLGIEIDTKAKDSAWRYGVKSWRGNRVYGRPISTFFSHDWSKTMETYFRSEHAPVFAIYGNGYWSTATLQVNPVLSGLKFQKVKDPFTAFQEIYAYVSGVLGAPPSPPEEPSDKLKAQIHGHEGEYSFKKPPGGKKWR